jgi:hypothetical protein
MYIKEPHIWHKRDQYTYVMHGSTYLYCDNQALSIIGSDFICYECPALAVELFEMIE